MTTGLEAAHIMPYRGTAYDHPENGLLLRADIHRLFDRLLISVNPKTLVVTLAPALLDDPQYSPLDKKRLILGRGPTQPSRNALKDHWRRFIKTV